jgi:preprotein translocase subunit YajC
MFVSPAYAQAAGTPGSAFDLMSILPLILIFVVFYFLLIRPQQKKVKDHRERISKVKRGDRIVTGGGIIGTVTRDLGPDEIQVEIAEGVRVKIVKATIADIRQKTEPVSSSRADDADDADADAEAEAEESKSATKQ